MIRESEILFEKKDKEEPAILVHLGENMGGLNIPEVQNYIENAGLNPSTFKKLLTLDFEPIEELNEEIFNSSGEKIEDVVFRLAKTEIGPVEVADVDLYPAVVTTTGKPDVSIHLKSGSKGGFEAIYVLGGEAVLSFPHKAEPVAAGIYATTPEGTGVVLKKGDLAIIPAPTANGWGEVDEGFKFRYICQPPWSSSFVKRAY